MPGAHSSGPLTPGSLIRPGPVGRLVRLVIGVAILWIFALMLLPRLDQPPGSRDPTLLFLVAVAGAFFLGVGPYTNLLLGKSWGRWPEVVIGALGAVLLIVSLAFYGRVWTPPLAWYLFAFTEIVFGLAGLSYILAGLFAAPG